MTLAKNLLKLWKLRIWVGVGVLLATVAAVASLTMFRSAVYSSASTQMLVDSPQSALANAGTDLTGYLGRAAVFARLMTSAEALHYMGRAAGVPGNLIAATGPVEVNGSPDAAHSPIAVQGSRDVATSTNYKLQFIQNPQLPTIDVYAEAPTTNQAVALANGAVTGFAAYIDHLEGGAVPVGKRIEIRGLGGATGGVVDPGANKKIAGLIFVAVLALWCGLVLFVNNLLAQLRRARNTDEDHVPATPQHGIPLPHPVAMRDRHAHLGANHDHVGEAGYSSNHAEDRNEEDDFRRRVGLRD